MYKQLTAIERNYMEYCLNQRVLVYSSTTYSLIQRAVRIRHLVITTKSASNNDDIRIAGFDQTCYTPSFEALTVPCSIFPVRFNQRRDFQRSHADRVPCVCLVPDCIQFELFFMLFSHNEIPLQYNYFIVPCFY